MVKINDVAAELCKEITQQGKPKGMKVRTLLKHFGFQKRTEENAMIITKLLAERGVLINPPITKLGDKWQLTIDDRICLTTGNDKVSESIKRGKKLSLPKDWNADKWFDSILEKKFRTEKEVENKFIIPLLTKLGYSEDDRRDDVPFRAAQGVKGCTLKADFALLNSSSGLLKEQVLLIVEAKKEERLCKAVELDKAQKQVESYAYWGESICHYGLVTDSKIIQVIDLSRRIKKSNEEAPIFECKREELKNKFSELYNLISKDRLTKYYKKQIKLEAK